VIVVYLALSLVGLVGTWFFNLRVTGAEDVSYLGGWFANPASSSAAVDLIVVAVAAMVFMAVEGTRLRMRSTWVLVALSLPIAISFTFPLFLALRRRRLKTAESPADVEVSGRRLAAGAPR
jgi:hypothetical protein